MSLSAIASHAVGFLHGASVDEAFGVNPVGQKLRDLHLATTLLDGTEDGECDDLG